MLVVVSDYTPKGLVIVKLTFFDTLARPDAYSIDTTNVLFVLSGAFVGLENIIKRRVVKGVRCVLDL